MKTKISIIVGGSGQLGIYLAKLLLKRKDNKVIITTRNINRAKNKINIKNKNLFIIKSDVLNKKNIKEILKKYNPNKIFYFAGQSSPKDSFIKARETYDSNVKGCINYLEALKKNKINCKFINASSSEIFRDTKKKIDLNSKKNPISPYGKAKLKSFYKTKMYRVKEKLKTYNAIIFNTESILRDKNYLIPKICLAAINAYFYKKKNILR